MRAVIGRRTTRGMAVSALAAALVIAGEEAVLRQDVPAWFLPGALVAALAAWALVVTGWWTFVSVWRDRATPATSQDTTYRQVVETTKEGVVTIDPDHTMLVVNQRAADMLGYTVDDRVSQESSHFSTPNDEHATGERPTTLRRKDGTNVSVLLNESPLLDTEGSYAGQLGLITDLSERDGLRDELAFSACHDPLTALPNHLLLVDRLDAALARAGSGGPRVAVVLIDVDAMKEVNSTYGHASGNGVLIELAARLSATVTEHDTVARSGGDEFVVVAEVTGLLFAEELADRLRAALDGTWSIGGVDVTITTSMGVAVGQLGDRSGTLLHGTQVALQRARSHGRGRTEFFTDVLRAESRDRSEMVAELGRALVRGEFALRFQPVVSLDDRRIVGAEALIRWEHPLLGTLGPAAFIPTAEESGLIDPIGEWVIEETSRRFAAWQHLVPDLSMSLNVSARQFTGDRLGDIVEQAVVATGMDPSFLAFEITEAMLMQDIELSVRTLTALRNVGVRISIDDFGTGYSSLSRLKRFPIDVLKIDQSFVAGLPDDAYDTALVQAVLTIGRALDLLVIAEGVENAAQATTLRDLGCTRAQGFEFYRPLTHENFESALRHSVPA